MAWQVPLVPSPIPVLLSGQHWLLLDGQGRPFHMLQLTRDLSVVHCQGPIAEQNPHAKG